MTFFGIELDLEHPRIQRVWMSGMRVLAQIILSMPSLEELYIFECSVPQLTVESNKDVTLRPTRYGHLSRGRPKKVFKGGESVILGIQHDEEILVLEQDEDTFYMENNK